MLVGISVHQGDADQVVASEEIAMWPCIVPAAVEDQKMPDADEDDTMDGGFQAELMDQPTVSHPVFEQEATTSIHRPPPPSRSRGGLSTNDQRFLLVFILGGYFGPDLRNDTNRKSALQRKATHAPMYTADLLGGSVFKLSEIESIYYYLLRKSHPSARVKLQSLYKFLHGHLTPPVRETLDDDRQFPDLFPTLLHKQSRYKGTYKVVESIVFIDDPDVSFMKLEDISRFKQLSGLSDLAVDRNAARSYPHGQRADRDDERQARLMEVHAHGLKSQGGVDAGEPNGRVKRRRKKGEVDTTLPQSPLVPPHAETAQSAPRTEIGAAVLLLPGVPTAEQWNSVIGAIKPSIVLTGTAAARQTGPLVGLVDIGDCEDAYLFRSALPGVKKEGDFHCEVEFDGKVTIKGTTTTGEARIVRDARVFKMQSQYLCPPGQFTVSFYLPGPVEPSQFTGTFGSDGILEGLVFKQRVRSGAAALTFES